MSKYDCLREEALAANLEIPKSKLAILTWGNVSAFDPQAGVFAIKPSGLGYDEMKADDMVVVDLDGNVVEGRLRPSSDTKTHLVLYKEFEGIRGILPYPLAPTPRPGLRRDEASPASAPLTRDQTSIEIPCTSMISAESLAKDYETGTGELIAQTFKGKKPLEIPMVIVAGHGPFTWGKSAMDAVHNAARPRGDRAHGDPHVPD